MAVDARETEIKYEATAGTSLPSFDDLPEVARTCGAADEQLDAEYFDTGDLRLIRAGITLRRRQGGHDAGWHLKLPAGNHTRREIRLPLGGPGGKVPGELARLVRVHTRSEEPRPVARISTRRRRLLLLGGSGQSLAEVASDHVTARAVGDPARQSQWHEVEVELTGGDRPSLRRSAPAGDVITGYLRAQLGALKVLDPMVRGDEPDSVHQMRTTARRLRSTLQSFDQFFTRSATEPLAAELRWFGTVLGEARDAEVLAAHLAEHVSQIPAGQVVGPVMARVRGHFARLGADAQAGVLEALDSPRYFALLDQLDQVVSSPPGTDLAGRPAGEVLPAAVRRTYARTRRRMKRALRTPPGDRRDVALHRARKAAKRARYAGEAVVPPFGKQASRFARQMKRLQSVLGEHQDAVIARQLERDLGMSAHLAGENAFSYGLMYERDSQQADRLAFRAVLAEGVSRPLPALAALSWDRAEPGLEV